MSIRGFDALQDISGHEQEFVALGYEAAGVHLHNACCSEEMVQGLLSAGFNLWSGHGADFQTELEYFEPIGRGVEDGLGAARLAQIFGQPTNTLIFRRVEFDVRPEDMGVIKAYLADFRRVIEDHGYLMGVFGSGQVCAEFVDSGLARAGWLASYDWCGFEEYESRAAIIQDCDFPPKVVFVELDTVVDLSVLWYSESELRGLRR